MNTKLRQISRLLKRYDSDLKVKSYLDGALALTRKRRTFEFYRDRSAGFALWFARDWDDLVLPITHTWTETGIPVDWGIEPILSKIQQLDGWRDDTDYDRFCKQRERAEADKKRAHKNEMKALAADCRKEFAAATNDINTSTIAKVEKRRIHDGYRR